MPPVKADATARAETKIARAESIVRASRQTLARSLAGQAFTYQFVF